MRVLIICGIFPPDIGGPARYVPTLASSLYQRGHSVSVLTLADNPDAVLPVVCTFSVHRIKRRLFLPWRMLRTIWTGVRLARRHDIILSNTLGLESAVVALLSGRPVVHKVVGDYAWERARSKGWFPGTIEMYQAASRNWRFGLLNLWRNFPLRFSQHVFTPSFYLQRMVWSWGVRPERTSVIYNSYHPPQESRLAPPCNAADELSVITICRLVSWKHVDGLIAAVQGRDRLRLTIVGDGPMRTKLEAQVRAARLLERVHFAGQCDSVEVMRQLLRADIFVLNSSYEGLPHVVIEAMGAGVPVVATPVGGIPELVRHGKTGLIVPMGDSTALGAALDRLAGDPVLARTIADAARALVETHFSLQRMVVDTEKLLLTHVRKSST